MRSRRSVPVLLLVLGLAAVLTLPPMILAGVIAFRWVKSEQVRLRNRTLEDAGDAVAQIDRYLAAKVAVLQTLASSPAFDNDDFARLYRQARELLDLQGSNIVLRRLDGQQLLNTRVDWGTPLPKVGSLEPDRIVASTGRPYISDLYHGTMARGPLIRVIVPVLRSGTVAYTLTASLSPGSLVSLLDNAGLGPSFVGTIVDRQGTILARSEGAEAFVGKPLPAFSPTLPDAGSWSGRNLRGAEVWTSYRRSPLSGWLVIVGVDKALIDRPLYVSMGWMSLCAVLLGAVSSCATAYIARQLVASQRALVVAAVDLAKNREVTASRSIVREADLVGRALRRASNRLLGQARALQEANRELEERVRTRTQELADQSALLEVTLQNMDQGLLMVVADGTVPIVNQRAVELLELPPALMRGRPTFESILRYQLAQSEFALSDDQLRAWVKSGGISQERHSYERVRPNGTVLEIRTIPLEAGGAVRTYTDITERRRREAELRQAEHEYRDLFENAEIGIYRSSPAGRQLRANPALVRMNGYTTEAEMLAAVNDIDTEWYVEPGRRQEFIALMQRDGRIAEFESEVYRHATRERVWISETAWEVRDADRSLLWFEGTVTEITKRKREEARIAHLSRHDVLTGLPNRAYFRIKLDQALATHRARGAVALLCLDLDRFKVVNDTLGHPAGDALLRQLAARISEALGPQDTACRLGGDEFAIIQIASDQPGDAEMLAAHLIALISEPVDLDGRCVTVGVSIGIARPGKGSDTSNALFAAADIALYDAKKHGRGQYRVFDDALALRHDTQRGLELDLSEASRRKEFVLEYQPILDTTHQRIVGFEALLRWLHPVHGGLQPASFIQIAEESGLIVPIGDWVLLEACRQAVEWPHGIGVSVNVSPVQFSRGDVRQSVVRALAASKLDPKRLEIDITESTLAMAGEGVLDVLQSLKSYGVRIALDDFGTGFSSLDYVRRYPVDVIKIDRSLVSDLRSDDTRDVLRTILRAGRRRGMAVIAEGVETDNQLAVLHAEGCGHVQGFLISKPVAADQVSRLLNSLTHCKTDDAHGLQAS